MLRKRLVCYNIKAQHFYDVSGKSLKQLPYLEVQDT